MDPCLSCQENETHPERLTTLEPLPEAHCLQLAELFKAMGDPTRLRILYALQQGELCVCDLAAHLMVSQSAVSHQLRTLRHLQLVRPRKAGKVVFYSLDDEHVSALFLEGLRHVEHGGRA